MENLNIIGKLVNRLRMINYMYITVIWDIKLEPEELWGRNNIEPLFCLRRLHGISVSASIKWE